MDKLTVDDLIVDWYPNCLTITATDGRGEYHKKQYIFYTEEEAVADFLEEVNN